MGSNSPRRLHNAALCNGRWLALALALALGPAVGGATEPAMPAPHAVSLTVKPRIGRIFFSPAERRSRRAVELSATALATPDATPESRKTSSERWVVNGALSSPARARAVWINGAAVDDSSANKTAWTDRNGNVWLNTGAQGTRLVRPGQSIDRGGAIEDLLPAGSVTRHSTP
jgi:hypothetical protein